MPGDEIFTSYGDNDWFESRDIPHKLMSTKGTTTFSRPLRQLQQTGHCLSDISIYESSISGAGLGVFAIRSLQANEVVSIAPVLVMPKHVIGSSITNSVLINYVLSQPGSDVSLFPLGRAGMVNNGGVNSSLRVSWYDWDKRRALRSGEMPDILRNKNANELELDDFSSLDICYVATRDIEKGEELTLYYGQQWEKTWDLYQQELHKVDSSTPRHDTPVFLEPIGVPEGMFPESWMKPCIGSDCNFEEEVSIEDIIRSKEFKTKRTEVVWKSKSVENSVEVPGTPSGAEL